MHTTLILEVDAELSDFIHSQKEMVDPSALINRLLREEKKRTGLKNQATGQSETYNDDVREAMEDFLDTDIQAAD